MIVNLVHVLLHLAGQRGRDSAAAGLALQMSSVGVELGLEIDQHRAASGKFFLGNGLLKFCVALAHPGLKRGAIEPFPGDRKLVDKRQMKIAQAFNARVTSGFAESRGAASAEENCDGAKRGTSNDKMHQAGFHRARGLVRFSILRPPAPLCQGGRSPRCLPLLKGSLQRCGIIQQNPFNH